MAPKRNRIICLIGMDGSGKTTHAFQIIAHFQKSGLKCRYVWFGAPYLLSYPFLIICRLLGLTKIHRLQGTVTHSEHQFYKNKPVALIWPWIQLLDLIFFAGLRVYRPFIMGFTVVCDRFTPDNLVELMADIRDEKLYKRLFGHLMLSLIPRSSDVFFLDVTESFAFRRKNDLPNVDYLVQRKRKYHLIAKEYQIPMINAERPVSVVQEEIIHKLEA